MQTVNCDLLMLRFTNILHQNLGSSYGCDKRTLNLRIMGAFQMVPPARGNKPSRRSQQTSSIVTSPGNTAEWPVCPSACPLLLSNGLSGCLPIRAERWYVQLTTAVFLVAARTRRFSSGRTYNF